MKRKARTVINPDHAPSTPQRMLTQEEFEQALNDMADEAIAAGADALEDKSGDPQEAAAKYYLMNLPALTSRRSTQLYLAAVARGMQLEFLDQPTAKNCVYIAQLALAAFGTQNDGPPAAINKGGVR